MDFSNLSYKQKQGLVGSILIFLGCFFPFVQAPIVGGVSLLRAGGWGYLVLLVAIASAVLVYLNKEKELKILSIVTTVGLVFGFIKLELNLSAMKKSLGNDPFGIAQMVGNMVGASYAWFFLFAGCVVLVATGLDKKLIKQKD